MKKVWIRALGLVGIPLALLFLWQLAFHSKGLWKMLAKGVENKVEEAFNSGEEEVAEEEIFDINQRRY